MNNFELRRLAGLTTETEQLNEAKKKVAKVAAPVEATFAKKAKAVVKELLAIYDGDVAKAQKALAAYVKKAGDKLENADQLEKAQAALAKKIQQEAVNNIRRLSGLALLREEDDSEEDDSEDEDSEDEDSEEDDLPAIIGKMAAKLMKDGIDDEEKLSDLLMKVYQAGHADGAEEALATAEDAPAE